MKKDGVGGANTKTGLLFEKRTDLKTLLTQKPGYSSKKTKDGFTEIFYKNKSVAYILKKYDLYKLLYSRGVDWNSILSKRLLPDDSIYVVVNNTLYIIEIKWQQVSGSTDEKLQTCDFKKKQYKKLLAPLNIDIEYIYLLNDWFKKPEYKDVLDYIISVGCSYYFEYIPLNKFNLPVPR